MISYKELSCICPLDKKHGERLKDFGGLSKAKFIEALHCIIYHNLLGLETMPKFTSLRLCGLITRDETLKTRPAMDIVQY